MKERSYKLFSPNYCFKTLRFIKPIILFSLLLLEAVCVYSQERASSVHAKDSLPIKMDTLKAAVVTARMRPRIKGDTVEYNTENTRLRAHGDVEELMRQLPGLQINADGTITYNGEKIQHLLVDGEDIFGSDPTIVTRNFDGSKIARIQIFDRKSDEAIFTGIDDGARTRTINLVLKESAKDGFFGKVEAGGNSDSYYNASGVLAGFQKKEQITAIGLASNTGQMSFSSTAGGSSTSLSILTAGADALGASAGVGIPHISAAALHYANMWNAPDEHLAVNYQRGHSFTQPVSTIQSIQSLPDSVYGQNQQSYSDNKQDQNWITGTYTWSSNRASTYKLDFYYNNIEGNNNFQSLGNSTFNDTLANKSIRSIQDNFSLNKIGGGLSWRTRISNNPEHTFSLSGIVRKTDNATNGYIYSTNNFFQPNGSIQSIDTINEREQIASHELMIGASINYTQPLWKGSSLGVSYKFALNTDKPLQATFDRGNGEYQEIIDSLSSFLKTQTITQQATLILQGKIKHLSYILGNDWLSYRYRQLDLSGDSTFDLNRLNWAPKASLSYTPNPATLLRFNYGIATQQPSVGQLQTVKNNSDPLHVTLGNPNLQPVLNHNLRLDFSRYKTWIISATARLTLNNNEISTKTSIDSLGRQISQLVNVNGGRTGEISFSAMKQLFGLNTEFYGSGTHSRSLNYINANLSRNDAYTVNGSLSLNKYVPDKYSFQLNINISHLNQSSSVAPTFPVRYWTQNDDASITLFLLKDFEFNTNASYTWQQKTNAFSSNTTVWLWNTSILRHFLHDRLSLGILFNNILNQNVGISRTHVANMNTQTSTNILGRYWIFSVTWHFDKTNKHK